LKTLLLIAAALLAATPALAAAPQAAPQPAPQPAPGDWRGVDAANTMVIDTNKGRIFVELYPEAAPASVAQIEALTRRGVFDGLTFFRVIDGFMDQTGDPKNTGEGGSDMPNLKAEFEFKFTPGPGYPLVSHAPAGGDAVFDGVLPVLSQPLAMAALTVDGKVTGQVLYCPGVVGMARAEDPGSGNSQFFLMRGVKLELDGRYTAIGRVVAGEDVVRAIKTGEPVDPPRDRMVKVQMLSDMAAKPSVQVLDTRSAYFAGLVARAKADKGDVFTPCDVDIPSVVK
jgi:peptidylprolyl isomerase